MPVPTPPEAPVAVSSAPRRSVDTYLVVQAIVVLMLGALALALVLKGDTSHAAEIGAGLIGALALNRKRSGEQ